MSSSQVCRIYKSLLRFNWTLTEYFEKTLHKLTISRSALLSSASKFPSELKNANEKLSKAAVRELAEKAGLLKPSTVNPHLVMEEGDISYYYERGLPRIQLEAEFHAKRLILDKADELEMYINEPGDLSEKSKPVKANLLNIWKSQFSQ